MRRRVALALVVLAAAAAAGCGDSPEDDAREAGEEIGGQLYNVQAAQSAEQAGAALDDIRKEVEGIRGDLPAGIREQLSAIAAQLQQELGDAQDPAARRAAFLNARSQFNSLVSDTDSVVNEFRRGVRQGFQDAAG